MNLLTIKDMDVTIQLDGRITSIIGPTNSGKTTILKKLCNRIENSDVLFDDVSIKEYDITFLKNNLVVVLDDNNYFNDFVSEELFYFLSKLGYRVDEITKRIDEIANYFKIKGILSERIDSLTLDKKMLIKLLSYLIIEPKILAIDDILIYLNSNDRKIFLKYIKSKNITLINVTTELEFLLLSEDVVVMNNFKALMCTNVKSLLDGNNIIPYMGLKLPFIVDLSHNLMLYKLIDKVYLEDRKLVDKLWK